MGRFFIFHYNKFMAITKSLGNFGEQLARNFLLRRGYFIIANNTKIGHGEIDIIAEINKTTVFIEVKTLLGFQSGAEESLSRRQIIKLKQIISIYCRQRMIKADTARLDFIAINLDRQSGKARIRHYSNIS
jgi:putative endonuclease